MVSSNYICQYCPDTVRSAGPYIIFFQGGFIDNLKYVSGTVAQSSSESDYNAAFTAVMALAHFKMLNNELMNKYQYVVPD